MSSIVRSATGALCTREVLAVAYSDIQKATACTLVKQAGGVIDEVLIATIRETLDEPKLPKMTIWRWWKHYQALSVTPDDVTVKNNWNVIDVTSIKLDDKLERAAHKFIDHAVKDDLMLWTNSKDAITAAAIAIDKMRLLRDLPTEIVGAAGILTDIAAFLRSQNLDFTEAQQQFLDMLKAKQAATKPVQSETKS